MRMLLEVVEKKNCGNLDQSTIKHTCSTELADPEINVPNYHGYAATINAAFETVPSFFIILMAIIYLLI